MGTTLESSPADFDYLIPLRSLWDSCCQGRWHDVKKCCQPSWNLPPQSINQRAYTSLYVFECVCCVCVWACGSPGSACEEWRQGGPKCIVFRYSSAPRTAVPVRMSSWCLFIPVLYCTVCVSETGWRCSYVREKGDDRDRDRNVLDRDVQMCEEDMHRCVTRGRRGGGEKSGRAQPSRLASWWLQDN